MPSKESELSHFMYGSNSTARQIPAQSGYTGEDDPVIISSQPEHQLAQHLCNGNSHNVRQTIALSSSTTISPDASTSRMPVKLMPSAANFASLIPASTYLPALPRQQLSRCKGLHNG